MLWVYDDTLTALLGNENLPLETSALVTAARDAAFAVAVATTTLAAAEGKLNSLYAKGKPRGRYSKRTWKREVIKAKESIAMADAAFLSATTAAQSAQKELQCSG